MFILGGDSEDLIQEGMLGLFKALRDYDCGRGRQFSHFCLALRLPPAQHSGSGLRQRKNICLWTRPSP